MKIVFRLNYHTVPSQSLWLKYATVLGEAGVRFDQIAPLHWINEGQWEATVEVSGAGRFLLEYSYQLRQSSNGVELDEWLAPRITEVDLEAHEALLLLDSWCSAGTVDYAFETNALLAVLPPRGPFENPQLPEDANHSFQLRMAAVPAGHVPCLTGGVAELGNWGWHSAIPLQEVAPNVWRRDLYLSADRDVEYKYALLDLKLECIVHIETGENRLLPPRAYASKQFTKIGDEAYRRDSGGLFRGAGVAIPVFSLRSEKSLGVGEFADLKPLADWASSVGLKLIQILPINDTTSHHDWRDSYPYSAISVFALHPLYLRIDDLDYAMPESFTKLLDLARQELGPLAQLDYEAVSKLKCKLTREVYDQHREQILSSPGFEAFLALHRHWVVPYALFCLLRELHGSADFSQWGEWEIYDSDKAQAFAASEENWPDLAYPIWLQYELDHQLADAVAHLHERGLGLKGDLPIGINRESVDAWSAPHLFKMEAQAGAPPDAFAVKGQNWQFPTYNWERMKQDGYAWWRSRFEQLSHYFDAYRIDHILGFFRIWQVPHDQVEGIMGYFDPALPIHIDEIRQRGIDFDYNRFCRPYIRDHSLDERFGDAVWDVKQRYLDDCGSGYWQLRESVSNQRRIADHFTAQPQNEHNTWLRGVLMDCASEVLFFEVPGSGGTLFHPRCAMQSTKSYQELPHDTLWRVEELYVDYFYRRQEDFWQGKGYEKLPAMRRATPMLLCGEDLGMVPACVPGVLNEVGILSLEIQRMPKTPDREFSNPAHAPYMSVVSTSTHDMSPIRSWWREDARATSRFAWQMFGLEFVPTDLSGETASRIIAQHLHSPAMWAIFPLQDLLAIDEHLRHPDPECERINVPAIMPYNWRYRMHLPVEQLAASEAFNSKLKLLLGASGR
ncbi:MAG: 4-alpha-glucanotransferase [Akkermansiaceae bacterium]